MVTGKYALIGSAVLLAGGIAWFATRSGTTTTGRVPASGPSAGTAGEVPAVSASPAGTPVRSPPARAPVIVMPDASEQAVAPPSPAPADDAAPAPTLEQTFAAEDRDRAWAPGHERALRERLGALPPAPVTVAPPECRTTQCRLTITAKDDAAIGAFVGLLEEPTGLHGWAEMIILEGVTALPNGDRQTRVYARFVRPQADDNAPK